MVRAMKLRASVRRERIDMTTLEKLGRGERALILGPSWYVSLSDGRWRAFSDWGSALVFAVRATSGRDPFE